MDNTRMREDGFLHLASKFFAFLWNVPTTDKVLGAIGAGVSTATLAAGSVSEYLGYGVAICTIFMVIPRGILNWNEMLADRRKKRDARIRALQALSDADKSSSDYGSID